jgi:hypothetical protein
MDINNWQQIQASADWAARTGHQVLSHNNVMYLCGGVNGTDYYNDVWSSTNGVSWTRLTEHAEWNARAFFGFTYYNNKFWIIAGSDATTYYKDVWSSDDCINWTHISDFSPYITGRHECTLTTWNNAIWLIGGFDGVSICKHVLKTTDGITWIGMANLAYPVRNHKTIVYNNYLYVYGGETEQEVFTNRIQYSNSDASGWTTHYMAAWDARGKFGIAVDGTQIIIAGGIGATTTNFNDVWTTNDGINWDEATVSSGFTARGGLALINNNSNLYIIGGRQYNGSGTFYNDIYINNLNVVIISIPAQAISKFTINNPLIIQISDILVDFVGVPRKGSSPLTVDFTAIVTFGGLSNKKYKVSKYHWYFDYDNYPEIYEITTEEKITHIYTGYYGQTFTPMLIVELEIISKKIIPIPPVPPEPDNPLSHWPGDDNTNDIRPLHNDLAWKQYLSSLGYDQPYDGDYAAGVDGDCFLLQNVPPVRAFGWTCDALPDDSPTISYIVQNEFGIQFVDRSTEATSWHWDFGGGKKLLVWYKGENNLLDSSGNGLTAICDGYINGAHEITPGVPSYDTGVVGNCFKCRYYAVDLPEFLETASRIRTPVNPLLVFDDHKSFSVEQYFKFTDNDSWKSAYVVVEVGTPDRYGGGFDYAWGLAYDDVAKKLRIVTMLNTIYFSISLTPLTWYHIEVIHTDGNFVLKVDNVEIAPDTTNECHISDLAVTWAWLFPEAPNYNSGGADCPQWHDEIKIYDTNSTSDLQVPPLHYYADTWGRPVYTVQLTVNGGTPISHDLEITNIWDLPSGIDFGWTCDSLPDDSAVIAYVVQNADGIQFVDRSPGAVSWHWDFGDGTTSDLEVPPLHYYPEADETYTVTCLVNNYRLVTHTVEITISC